MRATLLLAFLFTAACAPAAPGKLSNNGLVLEFAVLDSLEPSALTTGSSGIVDEESFGALLATAEGEDLFSYLMQCALDEGQQVTVSSTNTSYDGLLGLAPEWERGRCETDCQEWLSACVLAHTNARGKTVSISPRGRHEALVWNDEIEEEYKIEEAAFYGNLFLPAGQRTAVVCSGKNLSSESFNPQSFIDGRVNSAGGDELVYSGFCGKAGFVVDIPQTACSSRTDGYYSQCVLADEDDDAFDEAKRTDRVITIFLKP